LDISINCQSHLVKILSFWTIRMDLEKFKLPKKALNKKIIYD
jgi:hypothetical protein